MICLVILFLIELLLLIFIDYNVNKKVKTGNSLWELFIINISLQDCYKTLSNRSFGNFKMIQIQIQKKKS